jgi:hypothetical protein
LHCDGFFNGLAGGRLHFRSLLIGLKNHRETIILAVMLALVVLFAVTALAFPVDENPAEVDDIRGSVSWQGIPVIVPFISFVFLAVFVPGLRGKIRTAEYLDSHIGEKRFADNMAGLACVDSVVTAPFMEPSLFYSCRRSLESRVAEEFFGGSVSPVSSLNRKS